MQRQLERQRAQWGASRRVGGALPAFLALDIAILLTLVALWALLYAWPKACAGKYVMPWRLVEAVESSSGSGALPLSALPFSVAWRGFEGCAALDTSSALFWSSLYNLKLAYGLLSFPFLIFEMPIIGEALVKTRRTAYDQTGLLVPQLGKAEIASLYDKAHPNLQAKAKPGQAAPNGDLNA